MSVDHVRDEARQSRRLPRQDVQRDDLPGAAAVARGDLNRVSATTLLQLQTSAGSRAISSALGVQRHPEGEALTTAGEDAAEVSDRAASEPATGEAPAETRTATEEKAQKEEGAKAGAEFETDRSLTPGAQSLASAQKVLQGIYGGMKTFVPGKIEILADQAACSAKYDEVCIRDKVKRPDGSAWKPGDKAKDDLAKNLRVQGFAWKGVVYVNGATELVTATTHEMLHVNTSKKFRKTAGETFNEGATEYFARKALKESGVVVRATTAYPKQVKLTEDLIALVGEDVLQKAYFIDADELPKAYKKQGRSTFAKLKKAAEALDTAKVAEALQPKT